MSETSTEPKEIAVQLESHATPPQETPQQRYATLHRAIERGLDSDEIWRELADISLKLGHADEAVACLRRIRNSAVHKIVESHLARIGVLPDPSTQHAVRRPHTVVPAASNAGPTGKQPAAWTEPPGLRDHVVDALQYLFHQHMPWLVLVTTLAFPLLVGLGGFLTIGGSPLLLAAIAAIPGVCVVAVVGAMGRQILLASSGGSADVPSLPELGQLVVDARRFLADTGLVVGSLIAPSIVAMALGVPLTTAVPCLLTGAFFAPLAWALRQVRGDVRALSPVTLLRGVARGGPSYFALVPVCWILFAPAAITGSLIFDRPIWVQVAAIGPLCVVPLFVASRLLGTWLDTKRLDLAGVLLAAKATTAAKPPQATPSSETTTAETQPRAPRRPEALEDFRPPKVKRPLVAPAPAAPVGPAAPAAKPRTAAPAAQQPRPQRPPATRADSPAPAAARPPQPARPKATPKAAAEPQPMAKPAGASRTTPRAIEGRKPSHGLDDLPDLTQMPGAVVLTGSDRQRHGAAAQTRH
jgi:hypothetical protein